MLAEGTQMDAFKLRERIIHEYMLYVSSFIHIRDSRIASKVHNTINRGLLWPDPLIQINPAFESGGGVDDLVNEGVLHPECSQVFRDRRVSPSRALRLYRHQEEAIRSASLGANYILTTGTGSGKSLAYIIPIVDYALKHSDQKGIKAIIVYPLNALANSQIGELDRFINEGYPNRKGPVTFARYTGQESDEEKLAIISNPPDILLTNYVMMELIMTRPKERKLVHAASGLHFLVLDELHTYRGRQGADVALLVRRAREYFNAPKLQMVGTSATLAGPGSLATQKKEVAAVASRLFGSEVSADHVIGETLRRITQETDLLSEEFRNRLTQLLRAEEPYPTDYDDFVKDPRAIWIESTFGVTRNEEGILVRVKPRSIRGSRGVASDLAAQCGVGKDKAEQVIKDGLDAGISFKSEPLSGRPPFAFRLHQFISPSETVFTTLEPIAMRDITMSGQYYAPGEGHKLLMPLVFCRECGQEYYCVRLRDDDPEGIRRFEPRDVYDRLSSEEEGTAGYLYFSESDPWPEAPEEVLRRIPDDWLTNSGGVSLLPKDRRSWVPRVIRISPAGKESNTGLPYAFIQAPFRFCPCCGVAYGTQQKSDYSKLASLGTEGRSTATTILTLSAIRELLRDDSLNPVARKLLSFTDNRQDASLQAGHFNDFIEIGILRAALYFAVASAGDAGLTFDHLVDEVFNALKLTLEDFSIDSDVVFQAREDRERAFKRVLGYRIYNDLRRGWRVNTPNLEQCGLLKIEYRDLDAICGYKDLWSEAHPALASASLESRRRILHTFLDYMRRELAIQVEYLSKTEQDRIRQQSGQYLKAPWALDEDEKPNYSRILFPTPKPRGDDSRVNLHVSARGGFGKFLRAASTLPEYQDKLTLEETDDLISQLLEVLRRGGLVERISESRQSCQHTGYQLKASAMIWRKGDGNTPFRDPIRMPRIPDLETLPNGFFKNFYKNVAMSTLGFEAREHTAQVNSRERERREDRFRSGDLPVLFCSPTMELGVDIAELNVVNMRNVPPNPANYAQRSGRAGRSGQPALVFTYCGKGRAHDQYFFARPELMVAGAVAPPQIEMANEELIRSHLHSIWLTETGVSLGTSLKEIMDVDGDEPSLSILPHVRECLEGPELIEKTLRRADRVFRDLQHDLERAPWYLEDWFRREAILSLESFEKALERWRYLYRSAQSQLKLQNRIIADATRSSEDKHRARRLHSEADKQLQLLINDEDTFQSDFYSYRYFASEGFLPGYNFPRLPLSAFIPGRRKGHDEYLSRPRFLAISEFGPRAVIYHEGSKYEIDRVIFMLEGDEPVTGSIKLCSRCGYLHKIAGGIGPDLCERCNAPLDPEMRNMFCMRNVSARRRDRISADEEERQRFGYELKTALRFSERGTGTTLRTAMISLDEKDLVRLEYSPAATIWRINKGWKRRKEGSPDGFLLDIEKGKWEKQDTAEEDPDDPMTSYTHRVIPYVEDTRNALLFTPLVELDIIQFRSLQAAIKNAILAEFQLEDSELYTEALPVWEQPQTLLFYESSEGGAGVLRRLFEESAVLNRVIRHALEICHFDPDTDEDMLKGAFAEDDCGKACYDCLMSYGNQKDHPFLDRHVIHDFLKSLKNSEINISPVEKKRDDHLESLLHLCDSDLEKEWLAFIVEHGLNLPDKAQTLFPDCCTRADFFYSEHSAAVFIDGPDHDAEATAKADREKRKRLEDKGCIVLSFSYEDRANWMSCVKKYTSIFGSN